MIEVTETAQEKLGDYIKKNSLGSSIRVYLAGGG